MGDIDTAKRLFFEGLHYLDALNFSAAESRFIETLKITPRSVPTLSNLAVVQFKQQKFNDAASTSKRIISVDPKNIDAYLILASCQQSKKLYVDALASLNEVNLIDSTNADAHCNRGCILNELRRYEEALSSLDLAISIKPQFAEAYLNRGNTLKDMKRYERAFADYDKALALKPQLEGAWLGRGNGFYELKCYAEAIVAYDKALSIKPDLDGVEGARLHSKLHLCDWSNYAEERAHLLSSMEKCKCISDPFVMLGLCTSVQDLFRYSKAWATRKHSASDKPLWQGETYNHARIRIAYVSADFHQHAMSHLMVGMFECHDRSRFEMTAISIGPNDTSEMRRRVKRSFDKFINVKELSDDAIAAWIKREEIDILVDLNGYTQDARTNIFSRRPAPIQINYLGYPGTMGANYIDYLIGDQTVIPQSHQDYYSEKIIYLPNSYQVNDAKRTISDPAYTRVEMGLPQDGFIFCCFNNNYKILPEMFDCWMRILTAVEDSVLWLLGDNPTAASNLRKEADLRGVNPGRLVFAARLPLPDHLARHRLANLCLDTLPYNAHTTASDALWAGLPVLTHIGETFAGRVAASLLGASDMSELIAQNQEQYENMAVDLASHPEKLAAIKAKLAQNRLSTPLFNTQLFTRHIERAYEMVYERYQKGLLPDHIYVPQ